MPRLRPIRTVIAEGGPIDDVEARRLAIKATGRISDPEQQAAFYERLYLELCGIELARITHGLDDFAKEQCLRTLDEIEAASRPN